MIPQVETPATVVEGCPEPCTTDKRKIPVAYEEVVLTEEAAEILEKARKAASERPARNLRRMAAGAPVTRDN